MEARFYEFERRCGVHGCMRHKILLAEWRDHNEWNAKTSEREIARLVRGRHDRWNAVRTGNGYGPNVIVKPATFVKGLNKHRVLPGRAVHQRIDESGRKRRADLDVALRVLVDTAAAHLVDFDSRFYVGDLGQSSVLHISKVLCDGNHVGVVTVEIREIRKIRVPVNCIDFP